MSNELFSFHGGKLVVKLKEESKKQPYTNSQTIDFIWRVKSTKNKWKSNVTLWQKGKLGSKQLALLVVNWQCRQRNGLVWYSLGQQHLLISTECWVNVTTLPWKVSFTYFTLSPAPTPSANPLNIECRFTYITTRKLVRATLLKVVVVQNILQFTV